MAKKTTLRIDLKDSGFRRGIKKALNQVRKASSNMELSLKDRLKAGAVAGLKEIRKAAKSMKASLKKAAKAGAAAFGKVGDAMKSGVGKVSGLVAGIGFASLVKDTIDSQLAFKQLAFNISAATGSATSFEAVQKTVQQASLATGSSIEDLTVAYKQTFEETGDAKLAAGSLRAVGHVARQTGEDVSDVAKVAGILGQKFGVSAKGMGDALAQIAASSKQGGFRFEDLKDDLAEVAAKFNTMGAGGSKGMRKMVGFMIKSKDSAGNFQQAMAAIPQILDKIIEGGGKGGELEKKLKISTVDANGKKRDPFAIINDIVAKTKGSKAKLTDLGFGGEGLQVLLDISKRYHDELTATGGDVEAARAKLGKDLEKAAGPVAKYADVLKSAQKKTPADKMAAAITRLKIAFSQPAFIGAIEKLTNVLPPLADAFAKAMSMITGSPVTAALVGGGALAGKSLIGSLLSGGRGGGIAGAAAGAAGMGKCCDGSGIGAAAGSSLKGKAKSAGSLFAAAAFAGAAVGLAADQFGKLMGEIGAKTLLEVPEKLFQAFRQAGTDRERADQEALKNRRPGEQARVIESGIFGDTERFLNPVGVDKTGATQFARSDVAGAQGGLGGMVAAMAAEVSAKRSAALAASASPEQRGDTAKIIAAQLEAAATTGKATAAALASANLNVFVMNPEAIGGGGGFGGGTIPPGSAARQ